MRKAINRAMHFSAGAFFMSTVNGIINSNVYLWLPCMFLTLIALVGSFGFED